MKKLAVVLFVSFMAVSAGAANWVAVDDNLKKKRYSYVDIDSVSKQGNYKQSFVKIIDIPKGYVSIALTSYNCRSNPKRAKVTHATLFDLEGNIIGYETAEDRPFEPVLPESIGEAQANMVCSL